MEQIESKRHLVNFYLITTFLVVWMTGIGVFVLYIFKNEIEKNNDKFALYLIPIFSILFFYFSFKIITTYYKKGGKIILSKTSISIGSETFLWENIQKVELTGKNHFSFLSNGAKESMTLSLENGRKLVLFDSLYSNIDELKSFIFYKVLNNRISEKKEIEKDCDYFDISGSYLLNISTFFGWAFPLFFAFLFLTDKETKPISMVFFFAILSTLWFSFFSNWLYYFHISKTHLKIKNLHFFWYSKLIPLDNIYKVTFESPYKRPYTARIILKDFSSKSYACDSLKEKDWNNLKKILQESNIKVTDEIS